MQNFVVIQTSIQTPALPSTSFVDSNATILDPSFITLNDDNLIRDFLTIRVMSVNSDT